MYGLLKLFVESIKTSLSIMTCQESIDIVTERRSVEWGCWNKYKNKERLSRKNKRLLKYVQNSNSLRQL
jgi:hypothetical protein